MIFPKIPYTSSNYEQENIIKLDNDFIFELKKESLSNDIKNINELQWRDVYERQQLFIKIDFNNLKVSEYKRTLKKFLKIKEKSLKSKIELGVQYGEQKLLGYLINFNNSDESHINFIIAINAIFYNTTYDMYNYIYDYVCNYLDKQFFEKNLCNFQNDRCGASSNIYSTVGCCRHFKHKKLGFLLPTNKLIICEYLKNKRCSIKCISCKLFTCDYLEKKGIKFRIKDIFLLDTFFNLVQKYIIKYKVFTPKDEILRLLIITKF